MKIKESEEKAVEEVRRKSVESSEEVRKIKRKSGGD